MNATTSFIWEKLYPSLFDCIDKVFPDMYFKKVSGKWISPKKRDGTNPKTPRKDKSYITERFVGYVGEQGEDKSIDIISLYAERRGLDPKNDLGIILQDLCSLCGLEPPKRSEEWEREFQKEQDRQSKLIASYNRQKKALFEPEGRHVLQYLTTVRQYTEEEIRIMGLGYISPSEAEVLERETNIGVHSDKVKDYPLSWGFYSKGRIYGFKFRTIFPEVENDPQRSKYINTKNLPKNTNPFGLTPRTQPSNKDNFIIVTEGELDALHCIAKGLNVPIIATTGNGLTSEAVTEIKKKGFRRIVLLLDNDTSGQGFIPASIKNIEGQGLNSFVSVLPEGMGHDPDEFFRYGHTIEDLKKVLSRPIWGIRYLYNKILSEYGNNPTEFDFPEIEDKFIELLSGIEDSTNRQHLLYDFSTRFGYGSVSALEKAITLKADRNKAERNKAKKKTELEEALKKTLSELQEGKTVEASKTLSNIQKNLQVLADREKYKEYLFSNSDEIFKSLQERPQGLNSGFQIERNDGETKYQELIFPEGGISLIGGGTNHGKSTVLKNIVLNALNETDPKTNQPVEGTLLYFTFEENVEAVTRQFINAYADTNLNPEDAKGFKKSNIEIIEEVLSGYDTNLVKNKDKRIKFFKKVREFKDILSQQRLKIIRLNTNFQDELSGVVRFLKEEFPYKIRAVFVDYVQCLSVDNNGKSIVRTEELKEIMTSLDKEVQFLKIPFVMTAQLKRDVKSFDKLTNQDFDQSSWIEKTASEIVLIWSNRFKCEGEIKDTRLKDGQGGVIGAKLTKSRRYGIPSVMFLDIDEKTGKIKQPGKKEIQKEELHQFDIDAILEDNLFDSDFFNVEETTQKISFRPTLPRDYYKSYDLENEQDDQPQELPF